MTDKRKLHDALAGIRAILPAENEPAATNWKLVPVEPTEEMLRGVVCFGNTPGQVYKAMLAAAPRPDLTELRALPEKWLQEIEEEAPPEFTPEAVEIVRAWVRCATRELEALIERMGDSELVRADRLQAELDYLRSAMSGWATEVGYLSKDRRSHCEAIETGLRRAIAGKCDGNHFGPACPDFECWHRGPFEEGSLCRKADPTS